LDWILGDTDALTCLQAVYQSPESSEYSKIKAAVGALPFERPKLSVAVAIRGSDILGQCLDNAKVKTINPPCLDTVKGMAAPIGKAKLAEFTPKTARIYLHKVAEHYRPTVARTQLMLLSNLWQFAMRFDEFDPGAQTNPFAGIGESAFYTVEQEHEPWPEEVIERFLAACDENLYFAFHLLLCTGQRVSDVCAMRWSQCVGTRIALTQIKTKKSNDPMRIRVPDVLKVLLDRRDRVHEHILTHKWGRPYTRDSLGHRIKDVLIANGDGQYTVHGLRKNAGIMLAENGATVPMIMAALGHKSPKLALYYTRLADQAKLSDQAAEVVNMVFNRRAAAKDAKAKARRAQFREVL